MAGIRTQGARQKLVLTTTVTDCGVDVLTGDRAHLLVQADQTSVSTASGAASGASNDGAAMIAVDAVYQQGSWHIADFDTFGV
ncbi:Mce-associated membrane protein [Streptacidiphilus jiangxiensis]|uniref:Mce-associated membrane protein n=2 Tax=Streptacidiphilus jiangxiensis TaxID=235985 RepID=A0A1H7MQM2_STRJI|nr:Mce-associated membrane protein [Streptacidiphilus jiangxiensis]